MQSKIDQIQDVVTEFTGWANFAHYVNHDLLNDLAEKEKVVTRLKDAEDLIDAILKTTFGGSRYNGVVELLKVYQDKHINPKNKGL